MLEPGFENAATVGNVSTVEWRLIDDVRPLASLTERPAIEVSSHAIGDYERDGVCLLPGLFADWVEPLRAGLQRNLDHPGDYAFPADSTFDGEPGRFFDSYCNWQRVPEYLTFVLNSAAASVAAQLMGSGTAQLFHEHSFSKEAGTQKATPWHHDLPYYCVDGTQMVSLYVALDPIPIETGVQFLKGSHRTGELYFPRNFAAGTDYVSDDASMTSAPTAPDPADIFVTAVDPGDVLAFDFRTLHGSGDAPISGRRRAFSTRWLGDDVTYCERPGETSPPLVDLGISPGDRMRDDWFPTLWPN